MASLAKCGENGVIAENGWRLAQRWRISIMAYHINSNVNNVNGING